MKRKLAREQAALPRYLDALLNDESRGRTGAGTRPAGTFECLAFHVRGLMFAVPRSDSCGVVTDPSFLGCVNEKKRGSRRPSDQSGLLGVFKYRDDEIMTMDIAELVIPPRVRAGLADPPGEVAAVILIRNGRWGIVCDDPPATMTVAPEEMSWSETLNPRPWLAGVIAKRCVLLDAAGLCAALSHGPGEGPFPGMAGGRG